MMKRYKERIQELKIREEYYSECTSNAEMLRSSGTEAFRKTLEDIRNELIKLEKMSLFDKIRY